MYMFYAQDICTWYLSSWSFFFGEEMKEKIIELKKKNSLIIASSVSLDSLLSL